LTFLALKPYSNIQIQLLEELEKMTSENKKNLMKIETTKSDLVKCKDLLENRLTAAMSKNEYLQKQLDERDEHVKQVLDLFLIYFYLL
jgi:hypothetical protein